MSDVRSWRSCPGNPQKPEMLIRKSRMWAATTHAGLLNAHLWFPRETKMNSIQIAKDACSVRHLLTHYILQINPIESVRGQGLAQFATNPRMPGMLIRKSCMLRLQLTCLSHVWRLHACHMYDTFMLVTCVMPAQRWIPWKECSARLCQTDTSLSCWKAFLFGEWNFWEQKYGWKVCRCGIQ